MVHYESANTYYTLWFVSLTARQTPVMALKCYMCEYSQSYAHTSDLLVKYECTYVHSSFYTTVSSQCDNKQPVT